MAGATDLTKLVPGFDFLQGLMKNAGSGLPSISQWIAPTLDPDELEKRISELRTVQFWLEQNARLLGTTIQALEVQRMTLSTLKTMNLPMTELRKSLEIKPPEPSPEPAPEPAPARKNAARAKKDAEPPAPPAVDPMQWWGALTKQFTEIATTALKDSTTDAAKNLAGAMVKQSFDAAGQTLKKAAGVPGKVAAAATSAAASAAGAAAARKRRAR